MASQKVRGITIELGADTSGIAKALKNINSEIGTTQKQLKDVERLLKLDPGNTELLEQKQRLLNDQIGETKTKLESLKQAQKEVAKELQETGKGQEQYDALEREIISCEEELKRLEDRANQSNVALQKVAAAGETLKSAGSKVSALGDSMTRNVTVPIVGAGTAIVKVAGDFEQQMAKVSGIAQAYGDDLESLKQNAMDLAETTRFGATEIAQAYEYMGMAGWDTNQILAGTPGIIDLATASGEELATVSDIVTDGLTAFGLSAEDTSRFVNVLAEAARSSNTNVGMMGESFKYVAPVAGQMGYNIEDCAVALGLMANSGIKASMAGTTLRNMMQRMAKKTKESEAAMDRLGLSLTDDEGKMKSFAEIMQDIRSGFNQINMPLEEYNTKLDELDAALEDGTIKQKEYDKELEELNLQAFGAEGAEKARAAAMLGGTRAMAGLMAVAGATEEDFNALTQAIQGSSDTMVMTADGAIMPMTQALEEGKEIIQEFEGTAASMAGTMNNTTQVSIQQLINQLQNMAIQLGETLLPIIRDVVSYISEWAKKFGELSPETQALIVKIGLMAAALGPLLSVGGRLMTGIGSIMSMVPQIAGAITSVTTGTGTLGAAIAGLASPITIIIAAIAALVAAFMHLWNTNEEFRNSIKAIWNDLKSAFDAFGNGIVQRLNAMGFSFNSFGEVVKKVWDKICNYLAPMFKAAFEMVSSILKGSLDYLTGLFDVFAGLFTGNWKQMWTGVKEIFAGIWEAIKGILKAAVNTLSGTINGLIRGINGISVAGHSVNIPLIPQLASGGILTSGTAIVGEAGAEMLSVSNGQAVVQPLGGQNGTNELTGLLKTYLPYLAMHQQLVLDTGALVGGTAVKMNAALGIVGDRGAMR